MVSLLNTFDLAGVLLALWFAKKLLYRRRVGPLPPGPKPLPLIGNVLDMPTQYLWETFFEWGQRYGPLTHINIFGEHMIIVNSQEIAVDLLEKRGALYSDRPRIQSTSIIGYPNTLPLVPYGDRFREQRRMLNRTMGTRALVDKYAPLEEQEARYLLFSLLRDPSRDGHILNHIKTFTGAIILLLSYGYRVKREGHDPLLSASFESIEQFAQASIPGAFLVDTFPALRYIPSWFPGAGWKRKLHSYRELMFEIRDGAFAFTKDQMAKGVAIPNFMARAVEESQASAVPKEMEDIARWTGISLLGGGIDTTTSTLYAFFLAMTLYPDIQEKARAEIDAVVGQDRLPGFQDRDRLPYVNAICLELLRWIPVGPLGVPHRLTEDDMYDGYFFPEGTIFFVNIWGVLHDPKRYSNPSEFCPERYMKTSEKEAEPDPHEAVFGYGRRICPGIHITEASVFIVVANVLATFIIEKQVESGVPITPVVAQSSAMISYPLPFKCSVKTRSANAEQLILSAKESQENDSVLL